MLSKSSINIPSTSNVVLSIVHFQYIYKSLIHEQYIDLNLALGRFEPPTSSLWETRSNRLSYKAIYPLWFPTSRPSRSYRDVLTDWATKPKWRRGWDLNPRADFSADSLAVSWLRPLIHLSIQKSCSTLWANYIYGNLFEIQAKNNKINEELKMNN